MEVKKPVAEPRAGTAWKTRNSREFLCSFGKEGRFMRQRVKKVTGVVYLTGKRVIVKHVRDKSPRCVREHLANDWQILFHPTIILFVVFLDEEFLFQKK